MNNENVRASAEFRGRLLKLHQRGDEILGVKQEVVKTHEEVSENLLALLEELVSLHREALGTYQEPPLQRLIKKLGDLKGGVQTAKDGWTQLERDRKKIRERRGAFDKGHLQRIAQGQSNADSIDIPLLQDLTDEHRLLKDATGDFVKAYENRLARDAQLLKRLRDVELHKLYSSLKSQVSDLLDELEVALLDRKKWFDWMARQYEGPVYRLDGDYEAVRKEMERWEPLS